jgi:hypothetical protein
MGIISNICVVIKKIAFLVEIKRYVYVKIKNLSRKESMNILKQVFLGNKKK